MQSLVDWLAPGTKPIDEAIRAGWVAQGVGDAFLPAYRAALRQLIPSLAPGSKACICVTEEGGTHPRAIRASLSKGRLNGAKKWSTGGAEGDVFFVAARVGSHSDGRPDLRLLRVDPTAPGVHIALMPPTPFVPDVPHCTLRFENVAVAEADVLPGDGYTDYIKPFRTVEDIHVFAALTAWWLRVGTTAQWPDALRGGLVHQLVVLQQLAAADPNSVHTHVALGGALSVQERLVADMEQCWERDDEGVRERWERDKALLHIAKGARMKRFAVAMRALSDGGQQQPG